MANRFNRHNMLVGFCLREAGWGGRNIWEIEGNHGSACERHLAHCGRRALGLIGPPPPPPPRPRPAPRRHCRDTRHRATPGDPIRVLPAPANFPRPQGAAGQHARAAPTRLAHRRQDNRRRGHVRARRARTARGCEGRGRHAQRGVRDARETRGGARASTSCVVRKQITTLDQRRTELLDLERAHAVHVYMTGDSTAELGEFLSGLGDSRPGTSARCHSEAAQGLDARQRRRSKCPRCARSVRTLDTLKTSGRDGSAIADADISAPRRPFQAPR